MLVSAELRWFWDGQCPDDVSAWFNGSGLMSGPAMERRSDEYVLLPGNTEIGCKIRDAQGTETRSEIKGLITRFDRNRIELWRKWDWHPPSGGPRVMVHKQRQLRRFFTAGGAACRTDTATENRPGATGNTPVDACQIELTQVRVDGFDRQWWTLGLETWGDLTSAPLTLARGLDHLAPPVSSGRLLNYPQFLNDLLSQ